MHTCTHKRDTVYTRRDKDIDIVTMKATLPQALKPFLSYHSLLANASHTGNS